MNVVGKFFFLLHPPSHFTTDMNFIRHRIKSKREITKERRLEAEEKKRLEEDKAKVKENVFYALPNPCSPFITDGCPQNRALTTKSWTDKANQSLMIISLCRRRRAGHLRPLPGRM